MIKNNWILGTSVAEIEGQVELYGNITTICTILCVLFLIISIVLFFVFNIPKVISVKTGLEAKKKMKEYENGIVKHQRKKGEADVKITDAPLHRNTGKSAQSRKLTIGGEVTTVLQTNASLNETTVLQGSENSNETTHLQPETTLLLPETTLLQPETTLLSPETTVLSEPTGIQGAISQPVYSLGRKFIIERTIMMIHTNEAI